jgi:pyruvate dehydrogenase E1 component alpha subunit
MRLTNEKLVEMYTVMKRIRAFEERVVDQMGAAKIPGFVHLYIGEEAVAAGVCANLRTDDYITSTHRGHGHLIAKGGDPKLMMAELFGKKTGYCKGKGGSMHIADIDLGILGANGIVGGGPPIAAGAALAAQYLDTDKVSVCFLGDGASNQGTTHEAMNLAAVWKLPVVFVVENNGYGEFTSQAEHQAIRDVADRAAGYGMPAVVVDGNDVTAVYEACLEAVARAREGKGPTLVECKTMRMRGHFEGDPQRYRPEGETKEWQGKDPIPRFEARLVEMGVLSKDEVVAIDASIRKELDEAVRFAEQSPAPEPAELTEDVFTA